MVELLDSTEVLLVCNAGSSSLKFSVFDQQSAGELLRGQCDYGLSPLSLSVTTVASRATETVPVPSDSDGQGDRVPAVLQAILALVATRSWRLKAIGHRIVHGGPRLIGPTIVTPAILQELRQLVSWAPLHQSDGLSVIDSLTRTHGHLPQVVCFDTGFHATMPSVASTYALPRSLTATGIRRYGFHGLSYQSIAEQLREVAPTVANGRVVVAHLGSGASLCGMTGGLSQATTMGMTPLDGLPMATRCGSLDPGILLHLLQQEAFDVPALTNLLYRESGLKGVSGISGDLRTLLQSPGPAASAAVELFVYWIVREIGSMVAALQGLDALVFTGGIGENSAEIRRRVCHKLEWLGVQLDPTANMAHHKRVDTSVSSIRVYVLSTAEEPLIARLTLRTLVSDGPDPFSHQGPRPS